VGLHSFLELDPEHVLGFGVGNRSQWLASSRPIGVTGEPTESWSILGEGLGGGGGVSLYDDKIENQPGTPVQTTRTP
jgi:hypothetical protein